MSDESKPESPSQKLFTEKENGVESNLGRVSIRGWVTIVLVVTVCAMSVWQREIKEPLYTLAGMVVGWYFGQKKQTA